MKLLWLYLFAYLFLPIIGESYLWITNTHISAGNSSLDLIIHNIIFVVILVTSAYFVQVYKRPFFYIKRSFNYKYANRIFIKSIVVLTILFMIIFILGGYNILFGGLDRGQVRSGLGVFGPIYTLALSYLPIAIILYTSTVYLHLNLQEKKYLKNKLIIIYSFAILLGIISGYKSVAAQILIPGFVVLYFNRFNIIKLIFFLLIMTVLLIFFTAIVRHIGIADAFNFFIYRITTMTAYGVIAVWNHFPQPASFSDVFMNFLGMFGEKISSLLLGLSPHDPEFLKTNLSRLITYMVYPDTKRALANSVNVTVTNFGHALYICGTYFYHLYALLMGVIIGIIIRLFKNSVIEGNTLYASLIGLYFFAVIIPSINSGGIFMLFSIPVFIYFVLSYFILKYFIQG